MDEKVEFEKCFVISDVALRNYLEELFTKEIREKYCVGGLSKLNDDKWIIKLNEQFFAKERQEGKDGK